MVVDVGRFNVDITVNGADGVPTIALVKEYLKTMPALRPLVLLIKSLLEQHGLHSAQSSGLSSYCAICMVISFLQARPPLPISKQRLLTFEFGCKDKSKEETTEMD